MNYVSRTIGSFSMEEPENILPSFFFVYKGRYFRFLNIYIPKDSRIKLY